MAQHHRLRAVTLAIVTLTVLPSLVDAASMPGASNGRDPRAAGSGSGMGGGGMGGGGMGGGGMGGGGMGGGGMGGGGPF